MKTRKNFWATLFITMLWSMFFVVLEMMRSTDVIFWLGLTGLAAAVFMTYQILRVLQYIPDVLEKQETLRRSQRRVDELLNRLDEEELDVLRTRLADLDDQAFEPLGTLLDASHDKRKNR